MFTQQRYEIKTEKCGVLNVFVQGNIAGITLTTPVFMTVHDLGTNRKSIFYYYIIEIAKLQILLKLIVNLSCRIKKNSPCLVLLPIKSWKLSWTLNF